MILMNLAIAGKLQAAQSIAAAAANAAG